MWGECEGGGNGMSNLELELKVEGRRLKIEGGSKRRRMLWFVWGE
jgi:hypothetical protein